MTSYKNRTIDPYKPVRVYRNLHNGLFSVLQNGLVVAHMDQLCLADAKPHVNEAGRQRVIANKRKEVHAWIEGYIDNKPRPSSLLEVNYNPYKREYFWIGAEGFPIHRFIWASHIWLFDTIAAVED